MNASSPHNGCTHPRHPAIKHDGNYCCEAATHAHSAKLYYEPLGKDGAQLHNEAVARDLQGRTSERGVRPEES